MRVRYAIPVRNGSGETIDAWSIMQISNATNYLDATQDEAYTVVKPTANSGKIFVFNGPIPIQNGSIGRATNVFPAVAKFAGPAPAPGDAVGAVAGTWTVSSGGGGYLVAGGVDATSMRLRLAAPNGSTIRSYVVTATITPGSPTSPGSGTVQLYNDDGSTDGSGTTVQNTFPETFAVNTSGKCDMRTSPPDVISNSCNTVGG